MLMVDFNESTGNFDTQDNLKIFYRKYQADPERARMVIAHGLGEHSGRYGNIVERLLPKGITIWALDHRGHGQSDGPKGHILSFDQYINDLQTMVELSKGGVPEGMKCILMGHSMGGLIALNFALQFPEMIDSVIVSSPVLGIKVEVPIIKRALGKAMSSIWPGMTLGNEVDASKISHDEEVVRAYENDPLVHDRVSARWFTEFLSAMEEVHRLCSKLEVPTLMQVAGDDDLVDADASKTFFENLTLDDKTLYLYDGLYHEIYNEPEDQRAKVLSDLETWLENHI